MKYTGKLRGEFEISQSVEADSLEDATQKFKDNLGDDIEVVALGDIDVTDVSEVEQEAE